MNPRRFFSYNMQPIKRDYKSKIVYLELKENGRMDERITSKAKK